MMQARGEGGAPFHPHNGGTAMGGPSGNDEDGGFAGPHGAKANIHNDVNEFSKDDHSVKLKDKHVYPPPPPPVPYGVALGPAAGPFDKRSFPHGGTAEGGPSGNDEGQTFNMPITGNFKTDVNDVDQDDHSVDVKNKHIHPAPVVAPIAEHHGPPPGFHGPPPEFHRPDHFHVDPTSFHKRQFPQEGGTAMGGPGGGGHSHHGGPGPVPHNGGTAMGGPSGDDHGVNFGAPNTANIHNDVNEFSHDDHSVDVKHKDVFPPPHPHPHPVFVEGPPFKRGFEPKNGGTAMGGPSGDDGGSTFGAPVNVNTDTHVNEAHQDDHSVDLKHTDVYPPPHVAPVPVVPAGPPGPVVGGPFRRAYSPDQPERQAGGGGGGTAMGGPSGDDDGTNIGAPNSVDVNSNVNEHHSDNHAVKADTTDIHPPPRPVQEIPHMPWMQYDEPEPIPDHPTFVARPAEYQAPPHHEAPVDHPAPPHHEAPVEHPSPPKHEAPVEHQAPPEIHRPNKEETPNCAAQVHEVVHTVTKTHFKEVHPTKTVYQPMQAHVAESSAVPVHGAQSSAVPVHAAQSSVANYKVPQSSVAHFQAPQSSLVPVHGAQSSVPMAHVAQTSPVQMSAIPMQSGVDPMMHGSQVASTPLAASTPVVPYHSYNYNQQRPMSSAGAAYSQIPVNVPMATPASSSYRAMMTPGASMGPAVSGVSAQRSAKASASGSASHGAMFTGAANRVSGGIFSAAAAVAGVLAFVL